MTLGDFEEKLKSSEEFFEVWDDYIKWKA